MKLPAVIVNQDPRSFKTETIEQDGNILVINTPETGLSQSRNLLIKHADFDFGILCDDDIELNEHEVLSFADHLQNLSPNQRDGRMFRTVLIGDENRPWRTRYPDPHSVLTQSTPMIWRKIQKINSMELVLNLTWMKQNQIWFNPDFGLGSATTNGGEEVIMLNDALNAGAQVVFNSCPLRIHKGESSGQIINPIGAYTRGRIHQTTAPIIWWPLLVFRFAMRAWQKPHLGVLIRRYVKGLLQHA